MTYAEVVDQIAHKHAPEVKQAILDTLTELNFSANQECPPGVLSATSSGPGLSVFHRGDLIYAYDATEIKGDGSGEALPEIETDGNPA